MAQAVANLSFLATLPPPLPLRPTSLHPHNFANLRLRYHWPKLNGRFTCLLWDNTGKQEQARKALESALSGKKNEFEKWNKEIKKKEESGGGNNDSSGGGGGWFGWRRWFGDDNFWQQTQQTSLAVLCIILMYLLISKGETLFAVIFNPLLFALRRTRSVFMYVIAWVSRKVYPAGVVAFENMQKEQEQRVNSLPSAKERVLKKWGSD